MQFLDIKIFPHRRRRMATVNWVVTPDLANANFYVYKKYDGGAAAELLNETPVKGNYYVDTGFYIPNLVDEPTYRIVAMSSDNTTELAVSPEVALFSETSRLDFGIAYTIITQKYLQASIDGIPVLYYSAIRNGPVSDNIDPDTGQVIYEECEDSEEGDGEEGGSGGNYYYANGFYRPWLTYIRMIDSKFVRETYLSDGVWDSSIQVCEFLAFPPVRTGDLIVDVATDRRWIVGTGVKQNRHKSVIPVSYEGTIEQQLITAPCYNVPIPKNYYEMRRNMREYRWQTLK